MSKAKTMKIGDLRDAWGKYMPDGSVQTTADGQPIHLGIAQITGQAQTFLCDDGTTRQGWLSMRFFLDSAEFVVPPGLARDVPPGTKAPPTPPGAFAIGSKHTFGKSYLLDSKFGSPRQLDPSGLVNPHFGPGIVCGRDKIMLNGVEVTGYSIRDNLLHREWFCPNS